MVGQRRRESHGVAWGAVVVVGAAACLVSFLMGRATPPKIVTVVKEIPVIAATTLSYEKDERLPPNGLSGAVAYRLVAYGLLEDSLFPPLRCLDLIRGEDTPGYYHYMVRLQHTPDCAPNTAPETSTRLGSITLDLGTGTITTISITEEVRLQSSDTLP